MTITAPETTQERFSARLKESTKHVHDNAEHSTFMEDLMGGSSTPRHICASSTSTCTSTKHSKQSPNTTAQNPAPLPNPSPTRPRPQQNTSPRRHPRTSARKGDIDAPLPATAEYVERIRATINSRTLPRTHYLRYPATSPAARQSQRSSTATTASPPKR